MYVVDGVLFISPLLKRVPKNGLGRQFKAFKVSVWFPIIRKKDWATDHTKWLSHRSSQTDSASFDSEALCQFRISSRPVWSYSISLFWKVNRFFQSLQTKQRLTFFFFLKNGASAFQSLWVLCILIGGDSYPLPGFQTQARHHSSTPEFQYLSPAPFMVRVRKMSYM